MAPSVAGSSLGRAKNTDNLGWTYEPDREHTYGPPLFESIHLAARRRYVEEAPYISIPR